MRSMTGHGRGRSQKNGITVTIELAAVNRKQTDLRLNLPREAASLEPRLRSRIQESVTRGAITLSLVYEISGARRQEQACIDTELAAAVAVRLQALAQELGLSRDLRLGELLLIPGIAKDPQALLPFDDTAEAAEAALDEALVQLRSMQETEGAALCRDLQQRVALLTQQATELHGCQEEALLHYRDRLRARMVLLGVDPTVDGDKLMREAAFMAERSDIAEETTRLLSHLEQFRSHLGAGCGVGNGRTLDFLCQELGREINTLSAKSCDLPMARTAMAFRAELERIREQVQNVE